MRHLAQSVNNRRHSRASGNPAASDSERMRRKSIGSRCSQLFWIHMSRRRGTLDSRLRGNDGFSFALCLLIAKKYLGRHSAIPLLRIFP